MAPAPVPSRQADDLYQSSIVVGRLVIDVHQTSGRWAAQEHDNSSSRACGWPHFRGQLRKVGCHPQQAQSTSSMSCQCRINKLRNKLPRDTILRLLTMEFTDQTPPAPRAGLFVFLAGGLVLATVAPVEVPGTARLACLFVRIRLCRGRRRRVPPTIALATAMAATTKKITVLASNCGVTFISEICEQRAGQPVHGRCHGQRLSNEGQ